MSYPREIMSINLHGQFIVTTFPTRSTVDKLIGVGKFPSFVSNLRVIITKSTLNQYVGGLIMESYDLQNDLDILYIAYEKMN